MDPPNLEILVHISAPTTLVDDDHQRAAARAYWDFEGTRIDVPSTLLSHRDELSQERVSESPVTLESLTAHVEEHLSSRVLESSPEVEDARCVEPASLADRVEDSQVSQGSVLPDTVPEDMPDNATASTTRRFVRPLEQLENLQEQWRFQKPLNRPRPTPVVRSTLITTTSAFQPSGKVMNDSDSSSLFLNDTQLAISAIESQLLPSSIRKAVTWSPDKRDKKKQRLSVDRNNNTSTSPTTFPTIVGSVQTPRNRALNTVPRSSQTHSQRRESRSTHSPYTPDNLQTTEGQAATYHNLIATSFSSEYSGPVTFDTFSSQLPQTLGLTEALRQNQSILAHLASTNPDNLDTSSLVDSTASPKPSCIDRSSPGIIPIAKNHPVLESQMPPSSPPRSVTSESDRLQSATGEDIENKVQHEQAPAVPTATNVLDFSRFPRQVWPPPAEIGNAPASNPWRSQATPMLSALLIDLNTRSRYKPLSCTRSIEVNERGFWTIDTSPWPLQYQFDFWDNMADFIKKGRGGWGMWMARGREDQELPSRELGRVSIWCWGELVAHTYLLCWTMSSSKVITSRMEWCDGGGNVVVRMPVVGVDE